SVIDCFKKVKAHRPVGGNLRHRDGASRKKELIATKAQAIIAHHQVFNGCVQRRRTTFAAPSRPPNRPLQHGCYTAIFTAYSETCYTCCISRQDCEST
ncbi:MAG TPA: hypothetical protein V6C71_23570, partial [Coleofasciculaceae cyanobacterium]